jgi:hypothetical protein
MNWTAFFSYILDRLKEPSTYRGLTIMAASSGLALAPEHWQSIMVVGGVILGAIEAGRKEAARV